MKNNISSSEKIIKHFLKRKMKVTFGLVVSFLISGFFGYEEVDARDIRKMKEKEDNIVTPHANGPTMNKSINGTDVIEIVNPDKNGISHNKFIDLSVGAGNALIFNNSTENGVSKVGGAVIANKNLSSSASAILSEVTGSRSQINGDVEIFGKKADLIIANENGITVNGGTFINTSGVTLSSGAPSLNDNGNISFDTPKESISINGAGLSGDYFNVFAKTIEIHKEISALEGEKAPDITMIAGDNKILLEKGKYNSPVITESKNTQTNKYGIYASNMGAMYGNNIKLIATDEGLGVKHEGLISSEKDIDISSNGDIFVNTLASKENINIKTAKNFTTTDNKNNSQNSITAEKNISIDVKEKTQINSLLQSAQGNISIKTDSLENKGVITSKNNVDIKSNVLKNAKEAVIKSDNLNIEVENSLINLGEIRQNRKDMNEFVSSDGKMNIQINFGKFENFGNIDARNLNILTQELINNLAGKIIVTDGNIVITTSLGDIINYGDIFSDKNISLISKKDIVNTGKISGIDIAVKSLAGDMLNAGNISAVNKLEVIVKNISNSSSKEELKKYLLDYAQFSNYSLEEISKIITSLENKLNGVSGDELSAVKESLEYFKSLKTSLENIKNVLESSKELGIISGKDIVLKAGENIENKGIIEAKNDLFISAVKDIINSQKISAEGKLSIEGNSFKSTGNADKLNEYAELVSKYDESRIESLKKEISSLESQLINAGSSSESKEITSKINELKKQLKELLNIQAEISSFDSLGIIEGANIVISTVKDLENNGIIISDNDLTLKSGENITLNGAVNTGNDINIESKNFDSKGNITAVGNIKAVIENIFSFKNISASKNVDISAGKTINSGSLTVNENITVKGTLENEKDSTISAKKDVNLNGDIYNKGNIIAGNSLKTNGDVLNNSGEIDSTGSSEFDFKDIINSGKLNLQGESEINAEKTLNNTGEINIHSNSNIEAGKLSNQNKIVSAGNLSINADSIDNIKDIVSKNDLNINSDYISNTGDITAENVNFYLNNELKNIGNISAENQLYLKGMGTSSIENIGTIQTNNGISIEAKDSVFKNSGTLVTNGIFSAAVNNFIINKEIKSQGFSLDTNFFTNYSSLLSSKNVIINVLNKNSSSILGNITANNGIHFSGGNNTTIGKLQSAGDIFVNVYGDIENKGMIVGNSNIELSGKNIKNNDGNTIWTSKNLTLNAEQEIYNGIGSTMEAGEKADISAQKLINNGGTIKSGSDMNISANVENKSTFTGSVEVTTTTLKTLYKYNAGEAYDHWDYVDITIPVFNNNTAVKDSASISSGGDLNIKGDVLNESGQISSGKNIDIKGNLHNKTQYESFSASWLLENTTVSLRWETRTLGLGIYLTGGQSFTGTLKDALMQGQLSGYNGYYEALANLNNPFVDQLMSAVLGADWKGRSEPVSQEKWNLNGEVKFYGANANAQITAGGKFSHSGGEFNNDGGETAENKKVQVEIGNFTVDSNSSSFDVNIKDINQITELGPVKQVHNVEIITGEVTINGVTIKAEVGNTAGAVAVAGTISPIVFIQVPTGENGIFKPALPKPGPVQPMFETNIDFIDMSKFYGSEYFLGQIGYDKNKTSVVIGDAYYEKVLISEMIKKATGFTGDITAENIKTLLDNAASVYEDLGLVIGQPLTPEQINSLDKDIVWYVEVEINGTKVLTPQVYLSKDSRVELAKGQGAGGSSTVKADSIDINSTNFNNSNGNITSKGDVSIKSESDITNNSSGGFGGGISAKGDISLEAENNITNIGGSISGNDVSLKAGNDINIESSLGIDEKGNQLVSDKGSISADKNISIESGNDINIKGGNINSTDGNTSISGKNVNIEDQYLVSSDFKSEFKDVFNTKTDVSITAKSTGSDITGKNVQINAEKDISIKGSNVASSDSEGKTSLKAGNDINIKDTHDVSYSKSTEIKTGMSNGLPTIEWSSSEKNSSISKGSNIGGAGSLDISSGNDVNIQGSNLTAKGDINVDAENNINFTDGRSEAWEKSSNGKFQIFGGSNTTSEKQISQSAGGSVTSTGNINFNAGNNIKIVGGEFETGKDIALNAGNDVSIEAGKNEYHETTETIGVGLFAEGSAGVGGSGVSGSADTINMKAEGEIVNGGYISGLDGSNEKTPSVSGKPHMDQLVNSEVGVKIEYSKTTTDETTWNESSLTSGGNLKINAGKKADIGGGDFSAKGDVDITADTVDSTKYEDTSVSETTGFTLEFKQSQGVSSSIADTINKGIEMDEAIKSGNANAGIVGAQAFGAASNLIFNDLIGTFSKQSANLSVEHSKETSSSENITSIEGKNVNITAKDGNITLNGTDIKAENDITLDASENININAAKKSATEDGFKVDLEVQLQETAGISGLWGTNADIGVGGSVNVDITKKDSSEFTNSSVQAGGNLNIKSGKDTNVKGGTLEAGKDANIDVKGNLNIESMVSKNEEHSINANAGGDVSIGAASSTIGKGEVSLSGGGGDIWSSKETTVQSGIKAGGSLNAKVQGDLNMKGAVLGSETKEGSLEVGGKTTITDITATEQQGGSQITISGGFSGDMGIDGQIGDTQNKQTVTKSGIGLNTENISFGKGVSVNGKETSKEEINTDIENTQTVIKDEYSKGGSISLSGSVDSVKNIKDKGNSIKNKVNDLFGNNSSSKKSSSSSDNSHDININNKDTHNNGSDKVVNPNDKYGVLDKDNAFDFPKDNGIREEIKDTANEKKIVPDHYEPLNKEPSSKNSSEQNSTKNLENEIDTIQKDLNILNKVKNLTGGDEGLNSSIDRLQQELNKKLGELNKLDKESLGHLSEKSQIAYKGLANELNNLLKEQEKLQNKGQLNKQDKEKLDKIEKDMKLIIDSLNGLDHNKNNPQDVVVNQGAESEAPAESTKKLPEYKNPPSYEEHMEKKAKDTANKLEQENIKNLEKDINTIQKDLDSLNKVKNITGGDLGLNSTIDRLEQELNQKKKELNQIDSDSLSHLNEAYRDIYKKTADKFDSLSKEQEALINKGQLSKEDKEKLKKIEEEMRGALDTLNALAHEKNNNPQDVIVNQGDRFDVLDRDNAFDLPQDDGTRVEINDTANEKKIVPDHYEPLNKEPSSKNSSEQNSTKNLENEIDTIQKDLNILNKVKGITGGDEGLNASIDRLQQELNKKLGELNKLDKENLGHLSEKSQIAYKGLANELNNLLKEQEKLQNKGQLNKQDKEKLDKIEKDMKLIIDSLNGLDHNKNNPQDVVVNQGAESEAPAESTKKLPEYKNPPSYEEHMEKKAKDTTNKILGELEQENIKNLEKDINTIQKDLDRLNKVKNITGGDLGLNSSIDRLQQELNKKLGELNKLDKESLGHLSEKSQIAYKGLANELNNLLKEQEKIQNKGQLNKQDKEKLDKIEKDMKAIIDSLNGLDHNKNNPQDVVVNQGDRFDVLDRDNAFDLPQDDGTRVEIKDTANEEKIVPDHYEPLNKEPSSKNSSEQNSTKNLENEIDTIQKDLNILNKVKGITGGDEGLNASIDRLQQELNKKLGELNKLDKESLGHLSEKSQIAYKGLANELNNLLKEQEKIQNKGQLNKQDKEKLDKIEKDMKLIIDSLNGLDHNKNNPQDVVVNQGAESEAPAESTKKLPEYKNPPSYEEHMEKKAKDLTNKILGEIEQENIKNLEKDINTIQKDLDSLNKVKNITGGDLGLNSTIDRLEQELNQKKKELNQIDSDNLSHLSEAYQDIYKKTADKFDSLSKEQEALINKGQLSKEDKEKLKKIEEEMKGALDTLNALDHQKNNPQDVTINREEALNKLQKEIEQLLSNQKKLSDKEGLSQNDREKLQYIQEALQNKVSELNKVVKDQNDSDMVKKDRDNDGFSLGNFFSKKNNINPKPQEQSVTPLNKSGKLITRSEKDIRKNIDTVAKNVENIPADHLVNYLYNVLKNEELSIIADSQIDPDANLVANPKLNNDYKTEKNLNTIYGKIAENTNKEIRKNLNEGIQEQVFANPKLKELLSKDKLTKEEVQVMIDESHKIVKDVYEKTVGEPLKDITVRLDGYDPEMAGGYRNGLFVLKVDPNESPKETLSTILHEMTHVQQDSIAGSTNPNLGDLRDLFVLNTSESGYIKNNRENYFEQPIEKEAYEFEKNFKDNLKKQADNNKGEVNQGFVIPPVDYDTRN